MSNNNMEPTALLLDDLLTYDLTIMSDGFMGDDDHQRQIIDPGQRPVFVKTENIVESKATEQAVKELNMGHAYGINQQTKEPTLQDAVECLDDTLMIHGQQNIDVFESVSCIDEMNNFGLRRIIHCLTNDSIEIGALPSKKKKNPPYKVDGKDITTLNKTPVSFFLCGVKSEHSVHVSMRYIDEICKNTAVTPCKNHQDWKERPANLPSDFNFHLTRECSYQRKDNHPTAVVRFDNVDANEMVEFNIVFLCLNSCHKTNGKLTEVVITVLGSDGVVLMEERFSMRICRNVKRDHKQKCEGILKRKCYREVTEEVPKKGQRVMDEISQDLLLPLEATSGNSEDKPISYAFQMKSKNREDLILMLIKEMGGSYYPIHTPFKDAHLSPP